MDNFKDYSTRWKGGVYTPKPIMDLMEDGKISCPEAFLLSIVYAYSKSERGCFASNAHLGKMIGVKTRRAKGIIEELVNNELLIRSFHVETRRLLIHPNLLTKLKECER